jgi:outer membrane protein insertion porin family
VRLTYGCALGLGLAVIFLLPPSPAGSQTQTPAPPTLGTTPLLPETGLGGTPKAPLDNPAKSSLDNPIGTPAPGPAPTPDSSDIIRQIRIEGSQRIEPTTVRSYLTLQLGDRFDPEKMDESLKALFATGLYADVTLRREGSTLIIHVVENPIINRIAFEGNSKVEDKTLNGEIQLKPRSVYTRTKVQEDVKRILDVYRKNGRFGATVEPKVIVQPENRVDLVYEIHEGDKTHVTRISFIGNHAFSDTRLREKVQTSEYAWWKFLSSSDTYDADRLNYDRELLRKFYLSEGYADFRVVSAVAELAPNDEGFYVTFTLDEGDRYEFGKVMVKSAVKEVNAQELADLLTIREGTWYNADLVEDGVTKISNHLGNLGYAFVDVRPRVTRIRDKRTIDILFDVQQGPRVYVERINIKGNTRTIDKVILRELQFAEGDAYSTAKIEESRRRLKNLGYFESSDISNTPGSQPDTTIVNVDVKEQPTGQVSIGAGFSTYEGAIGDFGINESNFLGRGYGLGANFELSQRQQQVDLNVSDPYFMDTKIATSEDLFYTRTDYYGEANFRQHAIGAVTKAGYEVIPDLTQTWSYTIREDTIGNISDTSPYLMAEQGSYSTSEVGQTLMWDKRDNRQDPTRGYFLKYDVGFAGLGGNALFLSNKVAGGTYYPIADQWVASLTAEGGVMTEFGRDVPLLDRFYLGGQNLRGFYTGGVGPQDATTGDEIGGLKYYVTTAQLSFPIGLPKEFGILGHVFVDAGSLWQTDNIANIPIHDINSIRISPGFGISWKSPFGPIQVDLAYPVKREPYDKKQLLYFSFGTRF